VKAHPAPRLLKVLPPSREERSYMASLAIPDMFSPAAPASFLTALATVVLYLADDYDDCVEITSITFSCRKNGGGRYTVVFHGQLHGKSVVSPYSATAREEAVKLALSHALEGTLRWYQSVKTSGAGRRLIPVSTIAKRPQEIDELGQELPLWWQGREE